MDKFRKRMWKTARAVGLQCSPSTFAGGESPWDGDVLHGHVTRQGQGICDWWHEIGHFLVAPEDALRLRGWGQGKVYDGTDGGPQILDEAEESDASAVGIWCQQMLGLDPEGADVHAEYHSWISSVRRPDYAGRSGEKSWQEHLASMNPTVRIRVEQRLSKARLSTPWSSP